MADTDLLDYAGLKHYDSKIKSCMWNWQKTKKAGAVQFNPVPESSLEPVVDFLFTETPPASGDKSPSNPSAITGVTQAKVTRCGENLFNVYGQTIPTTANALPEADSDGYIEITGTPNSSVTSYRARCVEYSKAILDGSVYSVIVEATDFTNCYLKFEIGSNVGSVRGQLNTGRVDVSTTGVTCIACTNNNLYNANCILRLILCIPAGGQSYSARFRVSVIPGVVDSSSFSYAPYSGTDYTISLGSTWYGGSIDVNTGAMAVTYAAVTPAGETVDVSSAPASLPLEYTDTYGREITSTDGTSLSVGSSGGTVVYKLATPQAVQLTPTQIKSLPAIEKYEPRINTVYTDLHGLLVGYQRYADIDSILARLSAIEAQLNG